MALSTGDPVPTALADVEVLDSSGKPSRLGDRFSDGPAAIVFLRHFGCIACTEHVTLLAPRLHELTRLGLRVLYVGNGTPPFIDGFVERNAIDLQEVEVVTDPELASHQQLELTRSFGATYGPRALLSLGRAFVSGFRQNSIEGDNYQQGGIVVIDREVRVAYLHRDRSTGDHAPTGDVIDAAMRVAAAGHAVA